MNLSYLQDSQKRWLSFLLVGLSILAIGNPALATEWPKIKIDGEGSIETGLNTNNFFNSTRNSALVDLVEYAHSPDAEWADSDESGISFSDSQTLVYNFKGVNFEVECGRTWQDKVFDHDTSTIYKYCGRGQAVWFNFYETAPYIFSLPVVVNHLLVSEKGFFYAELGTFPMSFIGETILSSGSDESSWTMDDYVTAPLVLALAPGHVINELGGGERVQMIPHDDRTYFMGMVDINQVGGDAGFMQMGSYILTGGANVSPHLRLVIDPYDPMFYVQASGLSKTMGITPLGVGISLQNLLTVGAWDDVYVYDGNGVGQWVAPSDFNSDPQYFPERSGHLFATGYGSIPPKSPYYLFGNILMNFDADRDSSESILEQGFSFAEDPQEFWLAKEPEEMLEGLSDISMFGNGALYMTLGQPIPGYSFDVNLGNSTVRYDANNFTFSFSASSLSPELDHEMLEHLPEDMRTVDQWEAYLLAADLGLNLIDGVRIGPFKLNDTSAASNIVDFLSTQKEFLDDIMSQAGEFHTHGVVKFDPFVSINDPSEYVDLIDNASISYDMEASIGDDHFVLSGSQELTLDPDNDDAHIDNGIHFDGNLAFQGGQLVLTEPTTGNVIGSVTVPDAEVSGSLDITESSCHGSFSTNAAPLAAFQFGFDPCGEVLNIAGEIVTIVRQAIKNFSRGTNELSQLRINSANISLSDVVDFPGSNLIGLHGVSLDLDNGNVDIGMDGGNMVWEGIDFGRATFDFDAVGKSLTNANIGGTWTTGDKKIVDVKFYSKLLRARLYVENISVSPSFDVSTGKVSFVMDARLKAQITGFGRSDSVTSNILIDLDTGARSIPLPSICTPKMSGKRKCWSGKTVNLI